jgi:hypothetical protein
MELIWAPCAQLYSFAETRTTPPIPRYMGSYTRALLVSQDRRHPFVTPFMALYVWEGGFFSRSVTAYTALYLCLRIGYTVNQQYIDKPPLKNGPFQFPLVLKCLSSL